MKYKIYFLLKDGNSCFLDANITGSVNGLTTSAFRKSMLSSVFTEFASFIFLTFKIGHS